MKRRISVVIALVVSFLMMFSSIAMAEETQIQIPKPVSESGGLQIVIKVPFAKNDQSDSLFKQVYVGAQILEAGKYSPIEIITDEPVRNASTPCPVICPRTGAKGYQSGILCVDCPAP